MAAIDRMSPVSLRGFGKILLCVVVIVVMPYHNSRPPTSPGQDGIPGIRSR